MISTSDTKGNKMLPLQHNENKTVSSEKKIKLICLLEYNSHKTTTLSDNDYIYFNYQLYIHIKLCVCLCVCVLLGNKQGPQTYYVNTVSVSYISSIIIYFLKLEKQ